MILTYISEDSVLLYPNVCRLNVISDEVWLSAVQLFTSCEFSCVRRVRLHEHKKHAYPRINQENCVASSLHLFTFKRLLDSFVHLAYPYQLFVPFAFPTLLKRTEIAELRKRWTDFGRRVCCSWVEEGETVPGNPRQATLELAKGEWIQCL